MPNEDAIDRRLASIVALTSVPDRYLEAAALLEDLIYDQEPTVIDRIEALAASDATFKVLVASVFVGGVGGEAVDRFHALQERVFTELGRESPY